MKCPVCNNEMRDGYIPTDCIEWVPKFEQPHLKYKSDKSNGFRVGKHSFGDMKKQSAYYCESCNMILIDCSQEDVD